MNYELAFEPRALKEWQKLGVTVREQFKKKAWGCAEKAAQSIG
ncbi:putative addiction module toxin RelE [Escherichia coli 2-156-04_S3_C2]|nr:putative addiction module toxin RelE [Escherichia coli 2-156-04_S3_C2]